MSGQITNEAPNYSMQKWKNLPWKREFFYNIVKFYLQQLYHPE